MISAKKNKSPDGAGYNSGSSASGATIQTFDGLKAIQEHLRHVDMLQGYLCARTKEIPDIPLSCHAECLVAQWMHSEIVRECANRKLIAAVCKCCEEFHKVAAQSVLLTKMDLPEPVSDVIQSARDFERASDNLKMALAELHVECRLNQ